MKSTKPYEEEFKKRAVQLLRNSDKPAVQIARELGCTAYNGVQNLGYKRA